MNGTTRRLNHVALVSVSNVDKKTAEGDQDVILCNYVDVYKNENIIDGLAFMRATATEDQVKTFTLRAGDTLFTKDSETADDIGIPAYVPCDIPDLVCGYHLAIARPKPNEIAPKFLFWCLNSNESFQRWAVLATGVTRVGLRQSDIGKLPLWVPDSVADQKAIAEFLDRETAQIDALIGKQERLVDVLGERRRALIARTLTAGLDPAVETAPSRTDWLGNLPEHWQTVPTRYLCKITTGSEDSGNAEDDGEYPLYVRGREILRIGHYSFDCEAVMTPGDGQGGTGKVFHYFDGKFEAHQRVYVFKDFRNLLGRFFYYYLSTFLQPVALAGSNTVTMESLRRPLLAAFPVALPPIEEQGRIVDYLDSETAKIDALIDKAKAMNVVLRERRSALISAAVTGKIDVTKRIEGAA